MAKEGPEQRKQRLIANGISKKWDIKRRSRRPRGITNTGNDCYRNATLQPFFHFPRFVNWIKQHNSGGGRWPCNPNDRNRSLDCLDAMTQGILRDESYKTMTLKQSAAYDKNPNGGTIRPSDIEKHDPKHYSGCLPCLLKAVIKDYWSNDMVDDTAPYHPQPFQYTHDSVFKLYQLFQRYFCENPDGFSDEIDDLRSERPSMSQAQIDRYTRAERRENMTAQQDADELAVRIWDGIEASFNLETADGRHRTSQFTSLFELTYTISNTCTACHTTNTLNPEHSIGLSLDPLQKGPDTISAAISRTLNYDFSPGIPCNACHAPLTYTKRTTLTATPEYLRIGLKLTRMDPVTGEKDKIMNPIGINDTLNLSAYMANQDADAEPVVYKLHSVTYHSGPEITAGHYIAGVSGVKVPGQKLPRPLFLVDDEETRAWGAGDGGARNVMAKNPIQHESGSFDAVAVWYEIVPGARERVPRGVSAADRLCLEEGRRIAGEELGRGRRGKGGVGK
ncbi:hypothetical protein COCCADRAFT_82931 [Bipolaris zeicola 26-R-13]|uniref:USP domain-containing protein n=1 Tax=Cochliobolus carbonum (strain 26-R-13) TaxID=930089 RepID=W6YG74_COCC2|nr:uncharacterized protein COCCADRAFT_82931 [Bipolaris zeicola 26-R-13]EUC38497.1 hypothetical protein COCCADRAFT_82931 [Bipolaris zeicola 26-R-13]